jgi:eukaryotic-like serine/threonine-protein kinase
MKGPNTPSARPLPEPEQGPSRFGKYVLEQRIAVGGSSEVYLAHPAQGVLPAPRLVIKRLIPAVLEDPQSVGTFAMEARLHRAARHPNVVEVFEAGSVEGEPFLAMEYVDGVDAFRLMRRAQSDANPMPISAAVFVARELCAALACVHCAVDDTGRPLAVVHRDVTPSNVYVSENGDVKLGDFGIARMLSRTSMHTDTTALKGKYSYLSPEQVAGEDFDHRADLFSLAVMLSEMLINQSLFPGSGQLAVLLAIRDCRINNLLENASHFPPGLLTVLQRALARQPADRFSSAHQFSLALEPFEQADRNVHHGQLGGMVRWVRDASLGSMQTERSRPGSGGVPSRPTPGERRAAAQADSGHTPSIRVRTRGGTVLGPLAFSKVVEMIATSRLQGEDEVDLIGTGFRPIANIPELERHVPSSTATTNRLRGPGIPDYVADLSQVGMLEVCARMLSQRETGVLFAERDLEKVGFIRKEIYLSQARVVHVASSEASELLGEYLVRRGLITRSDLELALAVMPRYGGRIGDTLIGLNMIDAVQIFRAIRGQGRERITEVFRWNSGKVSYYRGVSPLRVEFPLDLDLAPLMYSGAEASNSDEQVILSHQTQVDDLLVGELEVPETMRLAAWPPEVLKVVGAAGEGRSEREIVTTLTAARLINIPNALRAVDVAVAAGLLRRFPSKRSGPARP